MYYEINISKNGRHYFATAARSLTDMHSASLMYVDLEKRFPESEGFRLSMSYHPECGSTISRSEISESVADEEYSKEYWAGEQGTEGKCVLHDRHNCGTCN